MHTSTMIRMKWFVDHYVKKEGAKVLDVGSYDVNGSYKKLFDGMNIQYVGLDIEAGPNVDVVMEAPYSWDNLKDDEFDYIISGQAFEHIEYPWLTIKEIYKKLKPGGVICIIAPNSAPEHRYPFDCYRYYADGFRALAAWAGFTVLDVSVAGIPSRDVSPEWDYRDNDACLIAVKGAAELLERKAEKFPYERRMDEALDLTVRYHFMYRWIHMDDKRKVLEAFIKKNKAETVYIYGSDFIGRLLLEELSGISDVNLVVVKDDKVEISVKEHEVMIISLLDGNKDLKLYLDKVWPELSKCYLDDIFMLHRLGDFLKQNTSVYVYGAGKMGKRMATTLGQLGYGVEGFVVSDGKREKSSIDNRKVFELGEIKENKEVGILIAVTDEFQEEIRNMLSREGFHNFRSA